jgi:tetratricopeptide (TPR) repeat protein
MGDCEKHLAECNTCRTEFAFLVRLLDENVSAEESAILDGVEARLASHSPIPSYPPSVVKPAASSWAQSGWRLTAVAASLVLAAGTIWVLFFTPMAGRNEQSAVSGRTLEARLAGQPYSEFIHTRTGATPENSREAGDELNRLSADHHEIGKFYLQHNKISEAIGQLETAEQASPNAIEVRNDLGVAYMESPGDVALEKAIREFQQALDWNPRYEPARFNLALAYERAGDFSQAEQQLRQYLQIDANSNWAREARSKLQVLKR